MRNILPGSPSLGTRWLHSKGHGQKCRVANFSKLFGSIHSYPYWKIFLVTTSRVWPSCCAIIFSSWLWQWLWAKCNFEARKSLEIHCFVLGNQGFYPIPIRLHLKFEVWNIRCFHMQHTNHIIQSISATILRQSKSHMCWHRVLTKRNVVTDFAKSDRVPVVSENGEWKNIERAEKSKDLKWKE